ESGHLVALVVGSGVVPGADHDGVAVGVAAVGPAGGVVEVAAAGRFVAVFGLAAADLDAFGDALVFVVEPGGAAEVEDLGGAAEDGGDDPGLAGEPAGPPGGGRLRRVRGGGAP